MVCTCVHIGIHMPIHVHMHTHIHAMHLYAHGRTHAHIYANSHAYAHMCMHSYACKYMHACMHTSVCMCITCICMCTFVHTCKHLNECAYMHNVHVHACPCVHACVHLYTRTRVRAHVPTPRLPTLLAPHLPACASPCPSGWRELSGPLRPWDSPAAAQPPGPCSQLGRSPDAGRVWARAMRAQSRGPTVLTRGPAGRSPPAMSGPRRSSQALVCGCPRGAPGPVTVPVPVPAHSAKCGFR